MIIENENVNLAFNLADLRRENRLELRAMLSKLTNDTNLVLIEENCMQQKCQRIEIKLID